MKFIFLLLLSTILVCCNQQPTFKFSGKVEYIDSKHPIATPDIGSQITLIPLDTFIYGNKHETYVDLDGKFEFSNLTPKDYLLVAVSKNCLIHPSKSYKRILNHIDEYSRILKTDLRKELADEINQANELMLKINSFETPAGIKQLSEVYLIHYLKKMYNSKLMLLGFYNGEMNIQTFKINVNNNLAQPILITFTNEWSVRDD